MNFLVLHTLVCPGTLGGGVHVGYISPREGVLTAEVEGEGWLAAGLDTSASTQHAAWGQASLKFTCTEGCP